MIGDGGKVMGVMSQSEDIILEMKNNYKHKKIKINNSNNNINNK